MSRLLSAIVVLLLTVGAHVANAANIKDYPRVAIMNFGNKAITSSGLREHDFSSAAEYAIYQLSACGWFGLVDYEQLSTIAKMHSVNMSGLVDPSTAVSVGKFAGAQFMVVGNVTGLTTKESVVGYQHGMKGGINNAQHVVTANVALRIVDIETGRIVVAGLGKGSSTSTNTEISFKKYRNRKVVTETETETRNVTDTPMDVGAVTDPALAENTVENIGDGTVYVDGTAYDAGTDYSTGEQYVTTHVSSDGQFSRTRNTSYEQDTLDYKVTIGTVEVSDIQVRNAISKAVRDAIYGDMGIMTTLNNGKPLKIKTGF